MTDGEFGTTIEKNHPCHFLLTRQGRDQWDENNRRFYSGRVVRATLVFVAGKPSIFKRAGFCNRQVKQGRLSGAGRYAHRGSPSIY
jgi:hypothetical protein